MSKTVEVGIETEMVNGVGPFIVYCNPTPFTIAVYSPVRAHFPQPILQFKDDAPATAQIGEKEPQNGNNLQIKRQHEDKRCCKSLPLRSEWLFA